MANKNQYDENRSLEMHNLQFGIAAEKINLEPCESGKIKHHQRESSIRFPLKSADNYTLYELMSVYDFTILTISISLEYLSLSSFLVSIDV